MARAEDLFERLRINGLDALNRLIDDREPESLFLDFKRSPGDGVAPQLAAEDNKNLSKAISGFGNSEGGVIVWGVDCRRDRDTGAEVASRHPLADASGFRTKIEGAISRASLPAAANVQTLSIHEGNEGQGYVVMLVPKSLHGPVRSVVTNHYHIRSGSDFGIIPHDVLSGMFGRSPRPRLVPNILYHFMRLDERREHLLISLRIIGVNDGAILAERPYFSVWFGDFPADKVHVARLRDDDYSLSRGVLPGASVVGKTGLAIAPGSVDGLCDIVLHIPLAYAHDIELRCSVGAQGTEPVAFVLRAVSEMLRRASVGEQIRPDELLILQS